MTYKNPDTFYKTQGKQPNHNLYRGSERDKKQCDVQLLHEPVLSLNTKQRSRSVWASLETGLSSNIRFCLLSFSLDILLVWTRKCIKTLHKYKRAQLSFLLCDCVHSARLRRVCKSDAQDQLSLRLSPM